MLPHQKRVVEEKTDLDERIAKLTTFTMTVVFDGLPDEERLLMYEQLEVMEKYSQVLAYRIGGFAPYFAP